MSSMRKLLRQTLAISIGLLQSFRIHLEIANTSMRIVATVDAMYINVLAVQVVIVTMTPNTGILGMIKNVMIVDTVEHAIQIDVKVGA
ncbi:hypothetical protein DRJ16_06955 [Candidatus Woesearchaeota archaeon]|nr:MAG: hypothetical protein DRJ16_06955 [Candidatus Woesearchaeota archaeon]